MLEPDPELLAVALNHKKKNSRFQAVPSSCLECSEQLPSKVALDKHLREVHPKEPPFNDAKQAEYLNLVRSGRLPVQAAKTAGVSWAIVKKAKKLDPAFAEALEEAEEEAAEEIEVELRAAALERQPWAVKEWLNSRSKARWSPDKTVNVVHSGIVEHRPELKPHENELLELNARARERARIRGELSDPDIIDVEIIDE